MASPRRDDSAELSPLTRRRLLREQRRRRHRVIGAVALLTMAVVAAGFAFSRHDAGSDRSARRSVRSGSPHDEPSTRAPSLRPTVHATATTARRHSPSKRRADAGGPPAKHTSTTERSVKTPPQSTTSTGAPSTSSTTAPPAPPASTPDPANADVEPQSPPATAPVGPQGPARAAACAPTGPPKVQAAMADGPSGNGQWVTVGRISGNCGATSGPLATSGVDTRLVYRSDAAQFQVFLIDQTDPSASSGFADVECRGACADAQDITDPTGRYELRVLASDAPWEVMLQEFR